MTVQPIRPSLPSKRKQASAAAAALWELLVETAAELDAGGSIEFIARDSGWSETSIRKRVNAAAYWLNRGYSHKQVVEMGPEKCVSAWQTAVNMNRGREPGNVGNLKMLKSQIAPFKELLKRIRALLGCDEETAIDEILSRYQHLGDSEIKQAGN